MDSDYVRKLSNISNEEGEQKEDIKISDKKEESLHLTRQQIIRKKLTSALNPAVLELEDVSYQHLGHAGVGKGVSETHFNVKIVSSVFEGKSLVKRHRLVYDLLQEELQNGLHALSIAAKTPSEAEKT